MATASTCFRAIVENVLANSPTLVGRFVDMLVEVPRDTGPQAPRATWRVNGTLQVTTSDATVRDQAPAR